MTKPSRLELYLEGLKAVVTGPMRKSLLATHTGYEAKESVERKLNQLLIESLKREDRGFGDLKEERVRAFLAIFTSITRQNRLPDACGALV